MEVPSCSPGRLGVSSNEHWSSVSVSELESPTRSKSGRYFVTSDSCSVCDGLRRSLSPQIEDERGGAAALSPMNYPVHSWYTYVQTYSPEFVRRTTQKVGASRNDLVIDPFSGTGTTLVEARSSGVDSVGIEAIDFLAYISRIKTGWKVNVADQLEQAGRIGRKSAQEILGKENPSHFIKSTSIETDETKLRYLEFLQKNYVSAEPLAKLLALKQAVLELGNDEETASLLMLAIAAIARPCSNMRFGPEIGLRRNSTTQVDVFTAFQTKIDSIVHDLRGIPIDLRLGDRKVITGDSREISTILKETNWITTHEKSHIITSPPYPQDHDYTRSVRLESVLLGFGKNVQDFRKFKKRMIRSSTRGIYSSDDDTTYIERFDEITHLARRIDRRVKETGGTSGFEKLYSKLVTEYFGGMFRFLTEAHEVLAPEALSLSWLEIRMPSR